MTLDSQPSHAQGVYKCLYQTSKITSLDQYAVELHESNDGRDNKQFGHSLLILIAYLTFETSLPICAS